MVASGHSVGRVLSQSKTGLYVCRSCRDNFLQTGVTTQQKRFVSKDILPSRQTNRRTRKNSDHLSILSNGYAAPNIFLKRQFQTQTANKARAQEQSSADVHGSGEMQTSTADSEEYKPAETWDGLEHVGYDGNWRNVPAQPTDTFSAWLNLDTEPVKTREATVSCLHQAIVECLVRQKAGLNSRHASEVKFTDTNRDAFASAEIIMSKTGQPMSVKFASEEQRQDVIDTLVAANKTATNNQEQETIEMETHTKDVDIESDFRDVEENPIPSLPVRNNALQYVVRDQSFLDLRLDAKKPVTFAILKRFSHLSGGRIPDPAINTILSSNKPLSALIERFYHSVIQPKPTKIADILMSKPDIAEQSNLMVFPRRETSVDKQKEVGRWKVIEKELHERGLPSLGRLRVH